MLTTKITTILFVDLDGTLVDSRINNTYHFIKMYYKLTKKVYGIIIFKLLYRIAIVTNFFILRIFRRRITHDALLIHFLFLFQDIRKLYVFSIYWLMVLVRKNLINKDVIRKIKQLRRNKTITIMLTACTEYPACIIAEYLGFDMCFARRFLTKWNFVIGIKDIVNISTHKLRNIIRLRKKIPIKKVRTIYIVDKHSATIEYELLKTKLLDHVIIV